MFATSLTLPASPAPDVATEIFAPSAIVNVGTAVKPGADRVICPAFPVLDAVLSKPLPAPEMETRSLAVTASVPPAPPPVVLLAICDPLARVKLLTLREMLPALPAPEVATEIAPLSPIVNVGVVTVIWPAFPVFDAVLNSPPPLPEIDMESAAVTVTLPP